MLFVPHSFAGLTRPVWAWLSGINILTCLQGGATGENLAAGYANASASVDAWGLEREEYNWNKPGFSEATGHFTQLVWSNTTSVGCGRTSCAGENRKLCLLEYGCVYHLLTICRNSRMVRRLRVLPSR
jgi:hypothetical protein